MKRIISCVAAVVLALAGVVVALAPAAADPPAGPLVDGCVIRLLSTGPVALDDTAHDCSPRLTGVSVSAGGDLVVTHDPVAQVITCTVAIDETLASRGVIAGASAGLTSTVVRFHSTTTHAAVRADSSTVTGSSSNIFVTWVSTAVEPAPSPTP